MSRQGQNLCKKPNPPASLVRDEMLRLMAVEIKKNKTFRPKVNGNKPQIQRQKFKLQTALFAGFQKFRGSLSWNGE